MRISGLSGSGLDIDGIVSETMQPYKQKVTNKIKERKLLEVKQSLYQDIIEAGQKLYDKYLNLNSKNSLSNISNYNSVAFSSNSNAVIAKGLSGAEKDNFTVSVQQLATKGTKVLTSEELVAGQTITLTKGNQTRTFTLSGDNKQQITSNLNTQLSEAGFNLTAKYSDFSNGGNGGMKIQTKGLGEQESFTIKIGSGEVEVIKGQDAIADITNGNGETVHYAGNKNSVELDHVEFTFNSTTVSSSGINNQAYITGETDVSEIKENIVKFVNEYNEFITDINTKLTEKKTDYKPLTDEEKSAMTENQIKLWDEKVKTGLLRNDGDLSRIANSLKSTMQTMLSGSGLKLEDIGIKPVHDFKTKNGTFTINEEKLDNALENNLEDIKKLFTNPEGTSTFSNGSSYSSGGIMTTLSHTFKSEFVFSSSSELIKKAGTKNSSVNSTITEQLMKKQKVIDEMNQALTKKEDKLYAKYSKLEAALTKLYSQQNWLSQQFSN